MIGYTTVGTNQMEAAVAFYDQIFKEVGVQRLIDFGERGMALGRVLGQAEFRDCSGPTMASRPQWAMAPWWP